MLPDNIMKFSKPIKYCKYHSLKKQQGAAVMLFSAVLLFGITSTIIYSTKAGVTEQKVTGNQIRSKQARQAANSGLTAAMLAIDKKTVNLLNNKRHITTLGTQEIADLGSYTIKYNTLENGDPSNILVTVNATSADGTGVRAMQQIYTFMPFLSNVPPATLVAPDDVVLEDTTVSLDNKSATTDTTIWCGRSMKKRGATGLGVRATPVKTTSKIKQKGKLQKRVKANVAGFPTGNALFEAFFTSTKANTKKLSTVIDCQSGCTSADIDGKSGLVWVDGNINMNAKSNKGAGQFNPATGVDNPIILIIDGELKMNHSSSQINGLVYVTQDWDNSNGNGGKIKGSVIVEGSMKASGALTLKYNEDILSSIKNNAGMYLPVPGTWKEI